VGFGISIAPGVIIFGEPVLALYKGGAYRDVAPVILPVLLQAMAIVAQAPFGAALRGMQRVELIFVHYLILFVSTVIGVVVGAKWASLLGASWGLALGAGLGFVAIIALYRRVITRDVPFLDKGPA
jgi:O-antigen/teichoic acid export membrane protein